MDALLNFETVALFGNAPLEVRAYDRSLTAYQVRGVRGPGAHAGVVGCLAAARQPTR